MIDPHVLVKSKSKLYLLCKNFTDGPGIALSSHLLRHFLSALLIFSCWKYKVRSRLCSVSFQGLALCPQLGRCCFGAGALSFTSLYFQDRSFSFSLYPKPNTFLVVHYEQGCSTFFVFTLFFLQTVHFSHSNRWFKSMDLNHPQLD